MSLEKEDCVRDSISGDVLEVQLIFKDGDGDQVRFDIDPRGELWVHVGRSIIRLSEDDVTLLLEKMRDVFALRVIT